MYLIVGLGNPGRDYKWTRHNVGFEVIDKLAYDHHIEMNKNKFKAIVGQGTICGQKVLLAKPQTYMNLSGESVRDLKGFYKIETSDLLVAYDEVSIPLGEIRIKPKGSDGGHNGMKNIICQLGDDGFPRIRIGVGEKPAHYTLSDFVLSKFKKEEDPHIIDAITKATDAVQMMLKDRGNGLNTAMTAFNKKNQKPKEEKQS